MLKLITMASLGAITLLTGCASTNLQSNTFNANGCTPVDEFGCASMQEAYHASRAANPQKVGNVRSIFDVRAYGEVTPGYANPIINGKAHPGVQSVSNDKPVVGGGLPYPEQRGTGGVPVYSQPQVLRVFTKPYVDADGNLRSGEQVYTATPGAWAYGSLKQSGSGSAATINQGATFGPADARNLGFSPAIVNNPNVTVMSPATRLNGTPPAPAQPTATPAATPTSNGATASNTGTAGASSSNSGKPGVTVNNEAGITQPYQRLSN